MSTPKGVVAICTNETGRAIATTSDFDLQGYGGFTLAEAQTIRAKQTLAFEVLNQYCHPIIPKAMSSYNREGLLRELCNNHGYSVSCVRVGHMEDDA